MFDTEGSYEEMEVDTIKDSEKKNPTQPKVPLGSASKAKLATNQLSLTKLATNLLSLTQLSTHMDLVSELFRQLGVLGMSSLLQDPVGDSTV